MGYQELVPELVPFLSDSERNRSERYHFKKDQNRFIICRIILKHILAEHINEDITKIIIDIDSHKKHYLPLHPSVFFNISHTANYALIAIANSAIGVDIEYINTDFNYPEILSNIFSKNEMEDLNMSRNKHLTFYKFWTRKEAIVKAIGKGIDDHLKHIPVTDGVHTISSELTDGFHKIKALSFNLNNAYVSTLAFTKDLNDFDKIAFQTSPSVEELKKLFHKK